jgi:hypothetical protein
MAFKLIESARTRWPAVNALHLVALVRAGAVFKNGTLIERPDESEVVISKSGDTPILPPIALPARRRRSRRLRDTRIRSRRQGSRSSSDKTP